MADIRNGKSLSGQKVIMHFIEGSAKNMSQLT